MRRRVPTAFQRAGPPHGYWSAHAANTEAAPPCQRRARAGCLPSFLPTEALAGRVQREEMVTPDNGNHAGPRRLDRNPSACECRTLSLASAAVKESMLLKSLRRDTHSEARNLR